MIYTISGQYGSGGNEIGQQLAERLGYRILDSQLVIRAREIFTEESGGAYPQWWPSRNHQVFDEEDDIPLPGTAYEQAQFKLQTDLIGSTKPFEELGTAADSVRKAMLDAQTKAIMEYIEGGNCVILGKCSNFILRGREDTINVFTIADLNARIKRIQNIYNVTMDIFKGARWHPSAYMVRNAGQFYNMKREVAENLIENTDHRRASCYEFITGEKWGDESKFEYYFNCTGEDLSSYVDLLADLAK